MKRKFQVGQKVFYKTLSKEATVIECDWGLGYLLLVSGQLWSAPEESLSETKKKVVFTKEQPELPGLA
jgi:hypothetical protein